MRTGAALRIGLAGEVDLSSHRTLEAALDAVDLGHAPVVELDLSCLAFCDARGIAQLVSFASRVRESGGRAVARDPSPAVRRLVVLLDAQDDLGLR